VRLTFTCDSVVDSTDELELDEIDDSGIGCITDAEDSDGINTGSVFVTVGGIGIVIAGTGSIGNTSDDGVCVSTAISVRLLVVVDGVTDAGAGCSGVASTIGSAAAIGVTFKDGSSNNEAKVTTSGVGVGGGGGVPC